MAMMTYAPYDERSVAKRQLGGSRVTLAISAAGRTDRGHRRAENQDNILCEVSPNGRIGIFAVADGMGGQRAGEIASALAIETLRDELLPLLGDDEAGPQITGSTLEERQRFLQQGQSLTDGVRDAIMRCNTRILQHAGSHPEARGLGSTLTLAIVKGTLAIIGNIGDSRTYRVRAGEIQSLTSDHSLVAHLAAIGQISRDEIYSHPQRSVIYRALGSENDAQPDIMAERLQSGDTLLLCSDGLWEMVRDESIYRTVLDAESLDEAATRLVQQANDNGGEDNISVIVVRIE